MNTKPAIEITELRRLYDALPAFPEFPGEREWPDRLRTLEDFTENGPITAQLLAEVNPYADDDDQERLRGMFPELWDLLFTSFPPDRGA